MYYFDNAATTCIDDEVLEAMLPYLKELYGNPSGSYGFAARVKAAINKAREQAAAVIGAEPDEIYFTSGGTEADNLALRGVTAANRDSTKKTLIISEYEHPAVIKTAETLESEAGLQVKKASPDTNGIVTAAGVNELLSNNAFMVSIMYANNEIGSVNSIEEIADTVHKSAALFHTDAVQAFGRVPINVKSMGIDLLSASSHKIHGPKGTGMLYINRGTKINTVLTGGGQERDFRSGTENVAGIVGFGKACEISLRRMNEDNIRMSGMRDRLIKRICTELTDTILTGPSESGLRLPGHASFAFAGVEGASLLIRLDIKNICASTGSACSASSKEPSHVLKAINVPLEYINGSLRLTLSKYTEEKDIDFVADTVIKSVRELREMRL